MQRQHINRKIWLALLPAIRNRISSGENRRTIFDDLSAKYIEQDRIAALIAGVPDSEDIPKLKSRTSFIFLSLCVYAAIHVMSILLFMVPTIKANTKLIFILPFTFIWPAAALVCAFQVRRYNGAWYRTAGWLSIMLIFKNLAGILGRKIADPFSLIVSIAVIFMLAASSFVALKVRKEFFPHISFYGVKKEKGIYVLGKSQG